MDRVDGYAHKKDCFAMPLPRKLPMSPLEGDGSLKIAVRSFRRIVILLIFANLIWLQCGCAAVFRGTSQTVLIQTIPAGRSVLFKGMKVADGELLTVRKELGVSKINVGTPGRPIMVDLSYKIDPWLIGDAGLLILFVVPGAVALGVDFGMGTWQLLDDPQRVYVPDHMDP